MRLVDLDFNYRIALVIHEVFRRLEVAPEDIYVCWTPENLLVVFAKQGSKEFAFGAGERPPDFSAERWVEIASRWNTCDDAERDEMWQSVNADSIHASMISALMLAGYDFRMMGSNLAHFGPSDA